MTRLLAFDWFNTLGRTIFPASAKWSLLAALCLLPSLAWGQGYYLFSAGRVCIDATHGSVTAGPTHSWTSQTHANSRTGTAMQNTPDSGSQYNTAGDANAPRLKFNIFNPGSSATVYLHVRRWAGTGGSASDSFHARLNSETWQNFTGDGAAVGWRKFTTAFTLSAGDNVIEIAMREDGVYVDAVLLTTDNSYAPDTVNSGLGPAESSLATPTLTTQATIALDGVTVLPTYNNHSNGSLTIHYQWQVYSGGDWVNVDGQTNPHVGPEDWEAEPGVYRLSYYGSNDGGDGESGFSNEVEIEGETPSNAAARYYYELMIAQ